MLFDLLRSIARRPAPAAPAGEHAPGALLARANALLGAGDAPGAAALAERVLAAAPGSHDALGILGAARLADGDPRGAVSALEEAVSRGAARADLWRVLGEARLAEACADPAGAADAFERARALDPEDGLVWLGLARTAAARGDRAEVRASALRASELLLARDRPGEAAIAAREVLALDAGDRDAGIALGRALLAAGDPHAAIESLSRAARSDPDHAGVHVALGDALFDLERTGEAIAAYERALALEPSHAPALCSLGMLRADEGDLRAARDLVERAIAIAPDLRAAHHNLGLVRFESGDRDGALAAIERCRALGHGVPWGKRPELLPPDRTLAPGERVTGFKLRHDLDQLAYLRAAGRLGDAAEPVIGAYREAVHAPASSSEAAGIDPAALPARVRAAWNRPAVLSPCPAHPGPAIDPGLDGPETEARWRASDPSVTWVDGLLTPSALDALWHWCLESCIWHGVKDGYLGAYMHGGFCSGLLLQIADELRAALPGILEGHRLQTMWAYKYDSRLEGIGTHADQAAVNVNFWVTPDDANLDPASGGLVVYTKTAPRDWSFRMFNAEPAEIERWLAAEGSGEVRVPYRRNRAVIFDSDLFHRTDEFLFRDGYESRRINVTMLFGLR